MHMAWDYLRERNKTVVGIVLDKMVPDCVDLKVDNIDRDSEVRGSCYLKVELSPEIGLLPNLQLLRLRANRFEGMYLSSVLVPLKNTLLELDLSENLFSGPLPQNVGELTSLTKLVLEEIKQSHSTLNGSLPMSLSALTNLEQLILRHSYINLANSTDVLETLTSLRELRWTMNPYSEP